MIGQSCATYVPCNAFPAAVRSLKGRLQKKLQAITMKSMNSKLWVTPAAGSGESLNQ